MGEQLQGHANGTLRCHQIGQCIVWSNSKEQWFHLSRSDKLRDADKRRQAAITDVNAGKLKLVGQRPSKSPASGSPVGLARWESANAISFDQDASEVDVEAFARRYNILQLPKSFSSVA